MMVDWWTGGGHLPWPKLGEGEMTNLFGSAPRLGIFSRPGAPPRTVPVSSQRPGYLLLRI